LMLVEFFDHYTLWMLEVLLTFWRCMLPPSTVITMKT
jgi:hypothetical protein